MAQTTGSPQITDTFNYTLKKELTIRSWIANREYHPYKIVMNNVLNDISCGLISYQLISGSVKSLGYLFVRINKITNYFNVLCAALEIIAYWNRFHPMQFSPAEKP